MKQDALQTKPWFCSPELKGLTDVLLQGVRAEDLVTVWLLAPHLN
jgi:hypothetical protein